MHCPECGARFVWPAPTIQAEPQSLAVGRPVAEIESILETFRRGDEPLYVLELGCGDGTRLAAATSHGWKCFGVEANAEARALAIERYGDKAQIVAAVADLIPHRFDLILMLDIVERVPDPYALMFSLFNAGAIGPQTRVVIATVDGEHADAQLESRLECSQPPMDLLHHTARSLEYWLTALQFDRIATSRVAARDGNGPGLLCVAEGSSFYAFMLERYVPGTWSKLAEYEHVPRYQFARRFARGAKVLDFGCGTGYGSRFLADAADDVLGLDIDADALQWATFWHDSDRLRFERHADLGATLPSGVFDLVTCFEMIEHVDHAMQKDTVASLARVVKPDGKLLISTPNPAVTANYGTNPYHLREMNEAEFLELLTPHFAQVAIYRQWVRPSILIGTEPIPSRSTLISDRLSGEPIVDEPPAFVAVCSHRPLETIEPFVTFDGSFDMVLAETLLQKAMTGLRFDNYLMRESREQAERQADQALIEVRHREESERLHVQALNEQGRTIDTMRASFDEQAANIDGLRAELAASNAGIAIREQALAERTQRAGDLQAALDEQGATIAAMRNEFTQQETRIVALRSVIERQMKALDQQDIDLPEMRQKFAPQEQNIVKMAADFAAQEHNIRELRDQLVAKEAQIVEHDRDLAHRDEAVVALEAAPVQRYEDVARQREQMRVTQARIDQRTAEKDEWARQYAALENTRFVRLARILHGNSGSRSPIVEAAYLVAGGLIPGHLKTRLAPLAAKLRGAFSVASIEVSGFVPYAVKSPVRMRAGRPRVLHVIANFMTGGSSRLVVDLLEHLGGDYEQHILTSFIPSPPNYLGLDIAEIRNIDDTAAMRDLIHGFNPHIVHLHYWGDVDEPWYRAVLTVAREHGCPILQNVNTPVAPFADVPMARNVFVSRYVLDHFGDGQSHNTVIYPGSDFTLFAASRRPRRAHGCIGMVYRLERDKLDEFAIEPFIEAARLMPGLKCLIVGGGSLLQPFKDRVHAEGLDESFEFTGYVSYQNLPALYKRMDVFVAPIWKESFGQVSAFAMNMGIPVIGYDVGAIPEIVADPSLVAPARDAHSLATIAVGLICDDIARESIGVVNRKRAARMFSVEAMIDSYRELYRDLLKQ